MRYQASESIHFMARSVAGFAARLVAAALLITAAGDLALANDSTAELGAGGILLTRSGDIALDSEDLFISMAGIRVDYMFRNPTERDIETVVAFPMPDVSGGIDTMMSLPMDAGDNFLGFTTLMDGRPVAPQLDQRAVAAGIDVTEELLAYQVPLLPMGEQTLAALQAVPQDVVQDWIARGIVVEDSYDDGSGWRTDRVANWTVRSTYWWRAIFPAGATVHVAHRYRPSVGGTAGLNFMFDDGPSDYFAEYERKYCMDDAFVRAVGRAAKRHDYLTESRVSYVLTSGGNWQNGVIGRFRLTVDKGSTANLVSFCGTGVRKITPTRFEMSAENFYPERDMDILFVLPPER